MEPLIPECSYHIFNHSNGADQLFKEETNYLYFLGKYKKHISPVVDTFAYCLMSNHFHLLVTIKKESEIIAVIDNSASKDRYNKFTSMEEKEKFISLFVSKQFSNLFSSYTQAFNKMYNRMGSLFIKNFKRILVDDDNYFVNLISYIHLNPVKDGFVKKPEDWKYSSYNIILSDEPTFVKRDEVIGLFGDIANFKFCHAKL